MAEVKDKHSNEDEAQQSASLPIPGDVVETDIPGIYVARTKPTPPNGEVDTVRETIEKAVPPSRGRKGIIDALERATGRKSRQ